MSTRNQTAEEIVRYALSSREAYDEMAAQEAAVWSRQLVDPKRDAVMKADQNAAAELGLNDNSFSFISWCRTHGRTFKRGLSIGCGAGRAERHLIDLKICESFHGVDIAADAIAKARGQAADAGYRCTYTVADLNFCDFGEERYDLVVAQTALHHLLHLEDVFSAIKRALVPGGIFWMHDFVGESQFQHSDLRLKIANAVLSEIPEEFRLNQLNGQIVGPLARRKPGTLISPFESIRSGEILPLAHNAFTYVGGRISMAILHLIAPVGTRAHYLKNEESVALFRTLKCFDESLVEQRVLHGTDARVVFLKE